MPSKQSDKCISSKIPCFVLETSTNKEKFIDLFVESYKNSLTQTMKSQLKRIFMLKLMCNRNSIAQRELCAYFRELKPECDSDKWKGESFRTLSSLIFNYIVQVQSNDRTSNKNKIADNILKTINEITQEHVLMNAPDNYVQAVQVFMAKAICPWLQKPMGFICRNENIKQKGNKSSYRSEPKIRVFKSKEKPKSKQKCHNNTMKSKSRTNTNKAGNCKNRNNRMSTGKNKTTNKIQNTGKCKFSKNSKNTQNKNKSSRKKDLASNRKNMKKKNMASPSTLFGGSQGTDQRIKKRKKKRKLTSKTRGTKKSKTVARSKSTKSIITNNNQQPTAAEERGQVSNASDDRNRLSSQNSYTRENIEDENKSTDIIIPNNSLPIDEEGWGFKSTDSNNELNDDDKRSIFTGNKDNECPTQTDTESQCKRAAQSQRSCSIRAAEEFGKKNAKEIKDIKCGLTDDSMKIKENVCSMSVCQSKIDKDQSMKNKRAEEPENEEKFEALAVKDMFKFMERLSMDDCIEHNEAKNSYPCKLSDEDSVQSLVYGVPTRSAAYYDYNDTVTTGQDDTGNMDVVYRIRMKTSSQYSAQKTILMTRGNCDSEVTCGCSSRPVETFTKRAIQIVRKLREVYSQRSQRSQPFRRCDCSK